MGSEAPKKTGIPHPIFLLFGLLIVLFSGGCGFHFGKAGELALGFGILFGSIGVAMGVAMGAYGVFDRRKNSDGSNLYWFNNLSFPLWVVAVYSFLTIVFSGLIMTSGFFVHRWEASSGFLGVILDFLWHFGAVGAGLLFGLVILWLVIKSGRKAAGGKK